MALTEKTAAILSYFKANPQAELTYSELAVAINGEGAKAATVLSCGSSLVKKGLLASNEIEVEDSEGKIKTYKALSITPAGVSYVDED